VAGHKPAAGRNSAHIGAENVAPSLGGGLAARRPSRVGGGGPGHAPALRPGFRGGVGGGLGTARSPRTRPTLGDITNALQARPAAPGAKTVKPPAAAAGQAPHPNRPAAATPTAPATARSAQATVPFNAPFDGDEKDVQKVAIFAAEVHDNNFQEEAALLPAPNYMDAQGDINAKMRAILIDWLIEVHMKYHFRSETLYLTVSIIDRYLSLRTVMRRKLQLVGVAAMFIASKFEEIDPPKVAEFAYITDNTYTKTDILSMECVVLGALDFQLVAPTPAHFFERLARANGCDQQHRCLAQYCMELGLLDIRMIRYAPSLYVSAALLLSNELLGRRPAWPVSMVYHARHRDIDPEMVACAQALSTILGQAPKASLQAVRRKYQHNRYSGVANLIFRAHTS